MLRYVLPALLCGMAGAAVAEPVSMSDAALGDVAAGVQAPVPSTYNNLQMQMDDNSTNTLFDTTETYDLLSQTYDILANPVSAVTVNNSAVATGSGGDTGAGPVSANAISGATSYNLNSIVIGAGVPGMPPVLP